MKIIRNFSICLDRQGNKTVKLVNTKAAPHDEPAGGAQDNVHLVLDCTAGVEGDPALLASLTVDGWSGS